MPTKLPVDVSEARLTIQSYTQLEPEMSMQKITSPLSSGSAIGPEVATDDVAAVAEGAAVGVGVAFTIEYSSMGRGSTIFVDPVALFPQKGHRELVVKTAAAEHDEHDAGRETRSLISRVSKFSGAREPRLR